MSTDKFFNLYWWLLYHSASQVHIQSKSGVNILFQESYSVLTKVFFISSRGGRRESHIGSDYLIYFLTVHRGRVYLIYFLTSGGSLEIQVGIIWLSSSHQDIISSQAGFAYVELTEKSVIILRLHNHITRVFPFPQFTKFFFISSNYPPIGW